jgi:sugar lactone lactonase YvrE
VVTDGYGDEGTGQLVKIDPQSWKQEVVLNNYLVQPFAGFNDLEIDPNGNFYLTDSKSAWVYSSIHNGIKVDLLANNYREEESLTSHPQRTPPCTSSSAKPCA